MRKKRELSLSSKIIVSTIMIFVAYKCGDILSRKMQMKIDKGNESYDRKLG